MSQPAYRGNGPIAPLLLHGGLLLAAGLFLALHFVHLSADFPNFSRWMDWSKYTDEGWYGDAAIRFHQWGHWYVPGDFNPAVALPVWPLCEALLFRFTGVSLVAERALAVAVFGGILVASWLLLARASGSGSSALAGSVAVLLLAVNPFCFVFTRMGILEPMLVFAMLLTLLVAQGVSIPADWLEWPRRSEWGSWFGRWNRQTLRLLRANLARVAVLGLLLPILVLTKTTGLFLIPAVAWMLFAALGFRPRACVQLGVPVAGLGLGLWLGYYLLAVRPHFLGDYRYLFSANAYTGINRHNWLSVIFYTLHGGAWMGTWLYALSLIAVGLAVLQPRRMRQCPTIPVLILWAAGYMAFLAYHNNLQPRYYLVIAIPLTLLVPLAWRELVLVHARGRFLGAMASLSFALALALVAIPDAAQTIGFVEHPEYTYVGAASGIAAYIDREHRADPAHSELVLSISGSDLSLMTGLHSICDDFGTLELADRVDRYKPGWYVSWNLIEDDKMDALDPRDRVTRVATFPAMDDQDRNLLILYRLDPLPAVPEQRYRAKPRRPKGKIGQQPSPSQLEH